MVAQDTLVALGTCWRVGVLIWRTESRDGREEGLGVGILELTPGSEMARGGGRCEGEDRGIERADSWAEVDSEETAGGRGLSVAG